MPFVKSNEKCYYKGFPIESKHSPWKVLELLQKNISLTLSFGEGKFKFAVLWGLFKPFFHCATFKIMTVFTQNGPGWNKLFCELAQLCEKVSQQLLLSQPDSGLKSETSEPVNLIKKLDLILLSWINHLQVGKVSVKPLQWSHQTDQKL